MCDYCNFDSNHFDNGKDGTENNVRIRRYTNMNGEIASYCLVHGEGWYDEYDNYDIETKINYCPMCGRKLEGE